ncbi:hypothetical protein BGZ65_007316 [Modicella reniformis]|uniref:UV excision repair protein RAD23 n=1 Tax=Modicella reniformis TaxID=1440133 RepID=A0A9P6JGX4_9FUNG|nr:hypothetical protein BGZ65_007316 [Modicella reniformis]
MLITIKTLKQETFKVEVDESDKVLAIKEKIAQSQGHPANTQKLIFSGKFCKILLDDVLISQYDIKEKDFLVIMVTKAKSAASTSKPAAAPASTSESAASSAPASTSESAASSAPLPPPPAPVTQTAIEQEPAAAAPAISPVVGETPTPAVFAEPAPPADSADSALLTGANFDTAIQNMMEMGFPREQCMLAMRASFNNPDRAAEYLMNGIPEHLLAQTSTPAPAPARPTPATAAPTSTTTSPSSTSATEPTAASTGGTGLPQNLFTAAAQAAASARRGVHGEAAGGGTEGDIENLAFLRDQPQFQQIRDLVQNNPDLLQPLLYQLGQSNPQMLQLINQNQQAFLQLLNEGYEEQEGSQPQPGGNHIFVTREEQEAIQRLESLGFDRRTAVEAFLACDRDEQLAANYLFDHGNEDFEEDAQ